MRGNGLHIEVKKRNKNVVRDLVLNLVAVCKRWKKLEQITARHAN